MEILAALGVSVVVFTIFMFAKFLGFKKRLMQEFARQGVPYPAANEAYLRAGDFINTMNADGRPINEIVSETIRRCPELF